MALEEPLNALRCDVLRVAGMELEGLIGISVGRLVDAAGRNVSHKNEQEIRSHFGDPSLNGVDHWISLDGEHILAQTKWKETTSQPEVAQFLACADRIVARLLAAGERGHVYLLWISKTEPTRHARAILAERSAEIVCCGISLEMLVRNVIGWVCETWGLDPTPAFCLVPLRRVTRVAATASLSVVPRVEERLVGRVEWDETAAGLAAKEEMLGFLQLIHESVAVPLLTAAATCPIGDIGLVLQANFPLSRDAWLTGSYTRINYNALLRTVKVLCCPTRSKRVPTAVLEFYCRVRGLSSELSRLAHEYMARRGVMVGEKSGWARRLPVLTCVPEPMTDTEYRGLAVLCSDYVPVVLLEGHSETS